MDNAKRMKIIRALTLLTLALLRSIVTDTHISRTCMTDVLGIQGCRLDQYKRDCSDDREESAFRCMVRKLGQFSNKGDDTHGYKKVGNLAVLSWLASLPLLMPNTAIINENTWETNVAYGLCDKGNHIPPRRICEHYRVDFLACHSLTYGHHTSECKVRGCPDFVTTIFGFPSIQVSGGSAHTMPFSEEKEVKLHGFNGYKDAFVFLLFFEPFKIAMVEKAKIKFRERNDIIWRTRSRLHITTKLKYLLGKVFKYRSSKFIDHRLKFYNLGRFGGTHKDMFPALPFFTIAKDDFYDILEDSNLMAPRDFTANTDDSGSDVCHPASINYTSLAVNLTRFLTNRKRIVVEGIKPFYVAELCLRNAVWTLGDTVDSDVFRKVWKQSARHTVSITVQNTKHMKKVVVLSKIFAVAVLTTMAAFGGILNHLIKYRVVQ